jgi:hypothetical protein
LSLSVLAAVVLGVLAGFATRGRLAGLAEIGVRWSPLAIGGLLVQAFALSFAPDGAALGLLLLSLAALIAFTIPNLRRPGFPLLLAGVLMNLVVIAVNGGMPVSAAALEAAGRQDILAEARGAPNAKHHLTEPGDRLLFLSDVIPIPRPAGEVVSIGDLAVDAGVAWFIAGSMRRRRRVPARPGPPARAGTG